LRQVLENNFAVGQRSLGNEAGEKLELLDWLVRKQLGLRCTEKKICRNERVDQHEREEYQSRDLAANSPKAEDRGNLVR
jgi:hypothetical protein